jgi:hypothetical protein
LKASQIAEKESEVFNDTHAFGDPACLTNENVDFMRNFCLENMSKNNN